MKVVTKTDASTPTGERYWWAGREGVVSGFDGDTIYADIEGSTISLTKDQIELSQYDRNDLEQAYDDLIETMRRHKTIAKGYALARKDHHGTYQSMLHKGQIDGRNDDMRHGMFREILPDLVDQYEEAKIKIEQAEFDVAIAQLELEKIKTLWVMQDG